MKAEALVVEQELQGQEPPMGGSRQSRAGQLADPEVAMPRVATRKRWNVAYKLRIAEEAEKCKDRKGELSALARREGLYSCALTKWMQWRRTMDEKGFGVTPDDKSKRSLQNEMKRLERENERLKTKLRRAEGLIELQKKVSRLLEDLSDAGPSES
jgi:transposase-like protein